MRISHKKYIALFVVDDELRRRASRMRGSHDRRRRRPRRRARHRARRSRKEVERPGLRRMRARALAAPGAHIEID